MPRSTYTAVIALVLTTACNTFDWHPEPTDKPLKITVMWSAADSTENYSSTHAGAMKAEASEQFKKLSRGDFELDDVEESENSGEAILRVKEMRLDPSILAVIGHSRSSMTRAAVPIYAEAGIPVLMPNATSPYALYRFKEDEPLPAVPELGKLHYMRFSNAFRLAPNDTPHQVNALKLTMVELSGSVKSPNVMLVCDVTKRGGADIYTKPMCDSLRSDAGLKPRLARYREFDLDASDIYGLVTEIHSVKAGVIAFIGYPELALELLEELKERESDGQKLGDYTFILSDACFTNEVLNFDPAIKLYVTYFVKPIEDLRCSANFPSLRSEEAYAFDAVMILASGARECKDKHRLERSCIREYLEGQRVLEGPCERYDIHEGERQNADYQVYSKCSGQFRRRWSARVEDNKLHDYENWCPQNHN